MVPFELVGVVLLAGCSLLHDLSPDQCGATEDCIGMFGAGHVCDDGVCKASSMPSPGGGPSPLPSSELPDCSSHAECIDRLGDVDPHACVAGACVPLRSDDCPLLLPLEHDAWLAHLTTSDAVLLGAYSPVPRTTLVSNITRFYDLAVSELTTVVRGYKSGGSSRRQIVMVVCDGATPSREDLAQSAKHLVDELRVPGIVSSLQSDDLQYLFEEVAGPAGVFVMSALDADATVANIDDQGLIWTMLTGADQIAAVVPPVVGRIDAHLQRLGHVAQGELRVALVAPTGQPRLLGEMGAAIQETLVFNDRPALENFPETFRVIDIDTVYGDAEAAEDQTEVVQQLLDFAPHVVLAMAANEFLSKVIPVLESQWPSQVSDRPGPFYVLSPYHLDNVELPRALEPDAGLRQRLLGVAYASAADQTAYRDYLVRLQQAYPELTGQSSHLRQENFYDAPYYLLYAGAAAGDASQLRGADFSRGMARLLSGPVYDIGRADMAFAFNYLESNPDDSLTLRGTLGPASFDPETGARADVGSVFCIDENQRSVPDIIRYDRGSDSLVDASPSIAELCIEGF